MRHGCIPRDSDDFQHRVWIRCRNDRTADGILARPEAPGGRLGHDRGARASVELGTRKRAAADDRDSNQRKVLRRDGVDIEFVRPILMRQAKGRLASTRAQRNFAHLRHRGDAGQRPEPLERLFSKRFYGDVVVSGTTQVDRDHGYLPVLEAGVHRVRRVQRAQQQRRTMQTAI